jgi:hypothetical protein
MSKSSKQVSEIDRLIELASDEKPPAVDHPAQPSRALSLEDPKDPPSMWRMLLQLRVLLPYLVKVLPLIERGLLGTNITGAAANAISGSSARLDTSHFDRSIAATQAGQRDLESVLKAQSNEIKFMQEQFAWLSKSLEKETLQQEQMAAQLTALKKQVTLAAIAIAALLATLIGLVAFALFSRAFHAG